MKTLTFYLAIFSIAFPLFLFGQTSWSRVTPLPQENTLNDIIKIPGTDKLIAVGEGSTVMISEDNGLTWDVQLNPAGQNNDYKCKGTYFINENTGFIYGGKETILKTTDGGINWYLVYSGVYIYYWQCINEIEFINETTGFAIADNGQLFKSSDTGETWELIETGVDFDLDVLEFSDDNIGFIFGYDDVYLKTTDGGESWSVENLPSSINGLYIKDVYFTTASTGFAIGRQYLQETNPGKIFKTTDTGNTWIEVYSDENGWYWPEAIDFIDEINGMVSFNTIMYGCINYVTNDGGETWDETPMVWLQGSLCKTLYYDENKAILSGNMGSMLYSENGGESWELFSERIIVGEILQTQFINDEIGFTSAAGGSGGVATYDIYNTTDSGNNWSAINYFLGVSVFHFINEDLGVVAENMIGLNVYKTTNGGLDWTEIESGNFDFIPQVIKFHNTNNGIIAGKGQIIKTIDSGYNWEEVFNTSTFWADFYDIEFISDEEIFIVGANNFTTTMILKSNDGGNSWEVTNLGNYWAARDIFFINDNIAFLACENNAILKSVDGGDTFYETIINSPNSISLKSIYFPTEEIGYAVGHGQYETIVKTIDGGETWNTINSISTSDLNAVHFFDENIGLVFGENGVVMKTTTGGTTGFDKTTLKSPVSLFNTFPNPFTSKVNIDLSSMESWSSGLISIYNQNGKLLQCYNLNNSTEKFSFSADKLKPGVYFFQLKTDKGISETRKMIKL